VTPTPQRRRLAAVLLAMLAPARSAAAEGARSGPPAEPAKSYAQMSLSELLQVEVTSASAGEDTLIEAPAVVTLLTSDDLDTYQHDSIADALRYVAGFDVLDDLTTVNVGVRGISAGWGGQSNTLKAMIDGVDVGFPPTAGSFLGPELIPMLAVDRVEVIRGPLSALYGANAFLGLVNVVPRSAARMGGRAGTALARGSYLNEWGNHGGAAEVAGWGTPGGVDVFVAASVRAEDRDGLALPRSSPRFDDIEASGTPLVSADDHERVASAYGKLEYGRGSTRCKLATSLQYADRTGDFQPHSEPLRGARLVVYNLVNGLGCTVGLGEQLELHGAAGLGTGGPTDKERLYDPFRPEAAYLRRELSYVRYGGALDLTHHSDGGRLAATGGADVSLDQEELPTLVLVETSGDVQRRNPGRSYGFLNAGVFGQLSWRPLAAVRTLGGLRFEHHSRYGSQLNYRADAVYSLSRHTALKALVGSSFQAPSPMQMLGGEHPRLLGVIPNAKLRPQRAITGELALTSQVSSELRVGLDGYYTRVNDLVELDTIAANPQARNRSSIDTFGADLELDVRLPAVGVSGFGNVSYVHSGVSSEIPVGIQVSPQTRLYPQLSASAGASYVWAAAHLRLFLLDKWVTHRWADKSNLPFLPSGQQIEYALAACNLLDLGVSTEGLTVLGGRRARVSLRARNVLGQRYTEPGFSGIDVPGRGRELAVTFEQEL